MEIRYRNMLTIAWITHLNQINQVGPKRNPQMMSTLDLFITPFALRHLANHAAGKNLIKTEHAFKHFSPAPPYSMLVPTAFGRPRTHIGDSWGNKKKTTTTTLKWGKGVVHVCYGTCCIDDKIGTPKSYSIIYQVFPAALTILMLQTDSLAHSITHSITQSLSHWLCQWIT